ncbi:MAG: methyltransferase [Bdellovibrionales bacterium RIFOXYD1_FULL_53_11]|nr:MAG: methyltransferase [Bdellovibrionales bacterium RIFOXYD1_FULL_53_11]
MEKIRLNLGCGGRPLEGYINVDQDSLDQLKARYPHEKFPPGAKVENYDIFHLPFPDGSVQEIRADSLIEHLSFLEEPVFFREVARALAPGGLFNFSTPDFEEAVRQWLDAKDDWRDFFRNDDEAIAAQHWFGQYSYGTQSRWGYLTAMIFGSQNGPGQLHRNCYTVPKIQAIMKKMEFTILDIRKYRWKGDRDWMIEVRAEKNGR